MTICWNRFNIKSTFNIDWSLFCSCMHKKFRCESKISKRVYINCIFLDQPEYWTFSYNKAISIQKEGFTNKGRIANNLRMKIFFFVNIINHSFIHSISYLYVCHIALAIPALKLLNHSRMLLHHIDGERWLCWWEIEQKLEAINIFRTKSFFCLKKWI